MNRTDRLQSKKKRRTKKKTKKKKEEKKEVFEVRKNVVPNPLKLNLTEEQKDEVIDRILEATNPNAPDNVVRFSHTEQIFKVDPSVEDQLQMAVHYSFDGNLIHKNGEEARQQKEMREKKRSEEEKLNEQTKETNTTSSGTSTGENQVADGKQLNNQFNFSQRASQTFNYRVKNTGCITEPPPTMTFEATATQWEIYDSYKQLFKQREEIEKKKKKKGKKTSEEEEEEGFGAELKKAKKTKDEVLFCDEMLRTTKIMERMLNQNTHSELLSDYKFWDDESDKYKENGSLLPLWTFKYSKGKAKHVTSLCWNTLHNDLFAVGYGSYDFLRQGTGLITCFSLKNPSFPEYQFETKVGVTSIDFHPNYPSLLAVGLYDGTVSIYDIRMKPEKNPLSKSSVKNGKHSDSVWEVRWDNENVGNNLSFFSISGDGRVTNWNLTKNSFQNYDVLKLKLDSMIDSQKESSQEFIDQTISGLGGGMCFDFNPHNPHLFVVGTEEGTIHQCSKAYNSQYLKTYRGHKMSVYSLKWNLFHENLFLSASNDWTVKLWDYKKVDPLMSFDLASSVGDVSWAPYSATVFGAVTNDGRVHVYDLDKSKFDSLCDQLIVKRSKLTHLKFNRKEPIIIVGDEKGTTYVLKLSPNLRKVTKELKL